MCRFAATVVPAVGSALWGVGEHRLSWFTFTIFLRLVAAVARGVLLAVALVVVGHGAAAGFAEVFVFHTISFFS